MHQTIYCLSDPVIEDIFETVYWSKKIEHLYVIQEHENYNTDSKNISHNRLVNPKNEPKL